MNTQILVPLTLAFVMVPLSGCIAAENLFEDMEDQYNEWNDEHHEDSWEDDWDEDCPEEEWEADDHGDVSYHEEHDHDEHRHDPYEDAYSDADLRYNNHVDGDEDSRRTLSIDWRDDDMRIALKYDLDGDVELQLRNPLGWLVAEEEFDGEKQMDEEEWYTVRNPMPGDWTLSIEIDGDGAYAFGVYLDD